MFPERSSCLPAWWRTQAGLVGWAQRGVVMEWSLHQGRRREGPTVLGFGLGRPLLTLLRSTLQRSGVWPHCVTHRHLNLVTSIVPQASETAPLIPHPPF